MPGLPVLCTGLAIRQLLVFVFGVIVDADVASTEFRMAIVAVRFGWAYPVKIVALGIEMAGGRHAVNAFEAFTVCVNGGAGF
jgi:hypothetical protein